jgi:hypothetical protein
MAQLASTPGDEIHGKIDGDAKYTVVGKDINQDVRETKATGGASEVNVNLWHPGQPHGQDQMGLSVQAEERMSREIAELRAVVNRFALTVERLDATLSIELQNIKSRLEADIQDARRVIEEQEQGLRGADQTLRNMVGAIGGLVIILLVVIAWAVIRIGGL